MFAEYRDYLGPATCAPGARRCGVFITCSTATGLASSRRGAAHESLREIATARDCRCVALEFRATTCICSRPATGCPTPGPSTTSSWARTCTRRWDSGRREIRTRALRCFAARCWRACSWVFRQATWASMNYLDVYRRESQRDFADGAGVMSRALIEGMFGIRPDALAGIVNIEPGWPERWNYAVLRAPQVDLDFRREEKLDRYRTRAAWPDPFVGVQARADATAQCRARARSSRWTGKECRPWISRDDQGRQWLEFSFPVRKRQEILRGVGEDVTAGARSRG